MPRTANRWLRHSSSRKDESEDNTAQEEDSNVPKLLNDVILGPPPNLIPSSSSSQEEEEEEEDEDTNEQQSEEEEEKEEEGGDDSNAEETLSSSLSRLGGSNNNQGNNKTPTNPKINKAFKPKTTSTTEASVVGVTEAQQEQSNDNLENEEEEQEEEPNGNNHVATGESKPGTKTEFIGEKINNYNNKQKNIPEDSGDNMEQENLPHSHGHAQTKGQTATTTNVKGSSGKNTPKGNGLAGFKNQNANSVETKQVTTQGKSTGGPAGNAVPGSTSQSNSATKGGTKVTKGSGSKNQNAKSNSGTSQGTKGSIGDYQGPAGNNPKGNGISGFSKSQNNEKTNAKTTNTATSVTNTANNEDETNELEIGPNVKDLNDDEEEQEEEEEEQQTKTIPLPQTYSTDDQWMNEPSVSHHDTSTIASKQKVPGDVDTCSTRETWTGRWGCRGMSSLWHHPLTWLAVVIGIYGVVWLRKRQKRRLEQSVRGEYRHVAARYADTAFDDNYSPVENAEYISDDDDGHGWVQNRGTIQMKKLGKEKLSLSEVNG